MSHPHDAVRVLPVAVAEDGSVTVFGLRYWSEEAVKLAPRLVEIRIAHAPYLSGLLVSLSGERLCEVSLVDDPGFVSKRRIFETLARLKPIDDGAPALILPDGAQRGGVHLKIGHLIALAFVSGVLGAGIGNLRQRLNQGRNLFKGGRRGC